MSDDTLGLRIAECLRVSVGPVSATKFLQHWSETREGATTCDDLWLIYRREPDDDRATYALTKVAEAVSDNPEAALRSVDLRDADYEVVRRRDGQRYVMRQVRHISALEPWVPA